MRQTVLLTGATGAVGAALLPELLALGFKVYCLVRPKGGLSPAERLAAVTTHPHAIALAGDVTRARCGVDMRGLKIDKVVHAAADTSLVDARATAVIDANRDGTLNVIALARALGNAELHYVGTTYIAGDAEDLAEQSPADDVVVGRPRNAYEASKFAAECQVRQAGLPFSVLRPAIVIGRSDDGSAPLLEGVYSALKAAWKIRDLMWSGRYFDENNQPISQKTVSKVQIGVQGLDAASLNLIQLDWVVATTARLVALPARGRTYNLAHHEPVPLKQLVGTMLEGLGMINVSLAEPHDVPPRSLVMIAMHRFIDRELVRFRPYLRPSPRFACGNVYADLGADWPPPPMITREFLMKSINRVEAAWRREAELAKMPKPSLVRMPAAVLGRLVARA